MSTNNTNIGGVRNLRAIFENKASDLSTSPPSRGRSPNGSTNSSGSRPVSKVRASFVSVERSGEGGSPQRRRLRKHSDINMDGTSEDRSNGVTHGLGSILKGSAFELGEGGKQIESQPTNPVEEKESAVSDDKEKQAASMVERMKQPNPGPPPMTRLETTSTAQPIKPIPRKVPPKAPLAEPNKSPVTPTEDGPVARPRGGLSKIQGVMNSAKEAEEGRQATAEKEKSPTAPAGNGPAFKTRGGGAKIQAVMQSAREADESRKATAEKEAGNPAPTIKNGLVRPRGGGAKILGVMRSAREAEESRKASQKAADDANEEKSNTGLPKASRLPTRPRSPKLSAASAAAKKDGYEDEKKPATRAPRVSNTTTASSLAKKNSRASLNSNDQPKPRASITKPADEGFLARLTRPTASSAQKVNDKVQSGTPPQPRRVSLTKKDLNKKPSRRSLTSERVASESKEEDTNGPVSVVDNQKDESAAEEPQQAGISAST